MIDLRIKIKGFSMAYFKRQISKIKKAKYF
jgi:hypothetical protein